MDMQEIKKEISQTETLVRMLKNSYNAGMYEGEQISVDDINSMFDLIIDKLAKAQS